ncbi:MAG: PASTA domain-containing protein, partial [Streptococcus mitis]|nr:PASTA domain-containing protein [Streptococcus mitis]
EGRPQPKPQPHQTEKPASTPKPAKRRRMKARYPILFATFLLVVASLVWILYRTPATIAVPKVAGQTVAEAKEALKKANFEVGEEKTEASDKVEEGRVIRTDPDAGTTRKEGTKINLIVSSGQQSFQLGNYIGRKSSDVVAELKGKKVPENLIKIEEEESNEIEAGTIMKQSLPEGTTYDLSKATQIVLTVAKKVNSVSMPSYIGSSREFTKNNLIQIVGVKEANIEIVEVSSPAGHEEGTVVDQSPKPGEKVDLSTTRVKISIYKAKQTRSSSTSSSSTSSSSSSSRKPNEPGNAETTPTQGNSQGNSQRGDTSPDNP